VISLWHVSSRIGVATYIANCYTRVYFTLLQRVDRDYDDMIVLSSGGVA